MGSEKREFYQLVGERYISDGVYMTEDVDVECETLEQCLSCRDYALEKYPEYVAFSIEHRVVTVLQ